MPLRRMRANVLLATVGCLALWQPAGAAAPETPAERPLVYNHITEEGGTLDQLVHRTYDPSFKVVDISDRGNVYVPPQMKAGDPPEAPMDAAGKPIVGKVVVLFIVTMEGTVAQPVILQSTDPRLSAAALGALALWVFQPARVNGQSVSPTGGQEFSFPPKRP